MDREGFNYANQSFKVIEIDEFWDFDNAKQR